MPLPMPWPCSTATSPPHGRQHFPPHGPPEEDLEQIAMLGNIQAARRYSPQRGAFRPYARTYANGEVYPYLRDKGFLIKVPTSWRGAPCPGAEVAENGDGSSGNSCTAGVSAERWRELAQACGQRVVVINLEDAFIHNLS